MNNSESETKVMHSEMIENHRENLFSRYVSLMNNEAFVKSVEICEQPTIHMQATT